MHVQDHRTPEELKRLERAETDVGRSKRMRIIILALEGWTAPAIATAVGLSRRICQRWVARYNEQGLAGLEDRRGRGPGLSLDEPQQAAVRERIDAGPTPEDLVCTLRGRDVRRILAEGFGVVRSLSTVYRLLHRLGYSCLRPRPGHRKSDPEQAAVFKREWPERLRQIAEAHPGERLRVYLQDESRFGPAGHEHERLGTEGVASDGGTSDGVQVAVGDRRGLPGHRTRRRSAQPDAEHGDREHVSGAVRPHGARGGNTR